MQYREVGDTGIKVSVLGHGTMRYKGAENAAEMIQHGLSLGLNYFDCGTAYGFKSPEDNAEAWVGAAIAGVPREQMVLSAKAQPRLGEEKRERGLGINTRDGMWQCIEGSLKRLGVQSLDFYQFWDMSSAADFEAACRDSKDAPLQAVREARDQGLIKHLGFTSHNPLPEEVINWLKQVPDFKIVTVYYNFNDRSPERVLDYAYEHGIGTCIMGPLRGGLLVGHSEAFENALPEFAGMPVQEIALRFLWGTPAVSTVISGMNEIAHMDANAAVADASDTMTKDQRQRFIAAFQEFSHGQPLCSGCRYCGGACPEGLPVWSMMGYYQLAEVFGVDSGREAVKAMYKSERSDPTRCTACGTCVEKCPQNLPIPEYMEKMAELAEKLNA
ncbi:MAG: aldo/keto reductase [Armatimonadia bacterium]